MNSNNLTAARARLRFGVCCLQRDRLLLWQAECLKHLHQSGAAELKLVITPGEASTQLPEPRRLMPRLNTAAFFALQRVSDRGCRAVQPADIQDVFDGAKHAAGRDALAAIQSFSLDFILWFGQGCARPEFLDAARYGVWSLLFSENTTGSQSGPACFQEICEGETVTRAALYRLAGREARAALLYEGFFPTVPYSWSRHRDQVLFGAAEWPARVCRDILNGCAKYLDIPAQNVPPTNVGVPGARRTLKMIARMLGSAVKHQLKSMLVREQWHVGIVRAPIQSFLAPDFEPRAEWLPELPRTRFFADPFALRCGPQITLLFEDFDHVRNSGRISAACSTDGGRTFSAPSPVGGALAVGGFHASYPYVFQHAGETYCVPETWERNEVALFRARSFPHDWERVCRILDGAVVDPTPFFHDGMWWMFYTRRDRGSNTKLYLAYAPALHGPWTKHPANPVKTDIRSARPGGTPFVHNSILYRPAQDSSMTYGGRLVIHQVDKLTTTQCEEHAVRRLSHQRASRYPQGFHTLAGAGELTIVDGKRFVLVPEIVPAMLAEKFRCILKRIGPEFSNVLRFRSRAR